MTILCIETSTSVCSAAICKDGVPCKQCICLEGSNHARLLPRYIETLLSFAREQNLHIDAVALSEGPGSYTGLRIGASTAKGLCYGLNVPLIPVSTLAVLCEAAKTSLNSNSPKDGLTSNSEAVLIPMIDARRMEVYTTGADGSPRAVVVESEDSFSAAVFQRSDLTAEGGLSAQRSFFYFGDGAAKCRSVLTSPNWHYIPDIVPEARFVASCLATISGPSRTITDLAYYEPFYLKDFVAAPSHVKGLR